MPTSYPAKSFKEGSKSTLNTLIYRPATLLLQIVLDWLGKLLGLPAAFLSAGAGGVSGGGCIQGTASEAAVVALLAGRSRALAGRPAEDHMKLVAYTSDQVRCMLPANACIRRQTLPRSS